MSYIIFKNDLGELTFSGDNSSDFAIRNISGLGTPEKIYETRRFLDFDGQITTSSRFDARTITMSVDITKGDASALSARLYRILSKGGTLYTYFKNGSRRIEVNQVSVDSFTSHGSLFRSFVIMFVCDNPYFFDALPITKPCYEIQKNICFNPETNSWNLDTLTIWGSNSNDVILNNSGDTAIYPIFTIHSMGASNDDAGIELLRVDPYNPDNVIQRFKLLYPLSDGEVITLCFNQRSDENRRYIKSSLNTNLLNFRSEDSSLSGFYLEPGENRVILNNLSYGNKLSASLYYDNQYIEGVY